MLPELAIATNLPVGVTLILHLSESVESVKRVESEEWRVEL
jgi:hypothetical protein